VLSPWEEAVVELLDGSCVSTDGTRIRHLSATVPIPLDPRTEYVLDVEQVDLAAPADATGPSVLRRSFTTSAFGDFAAYAAAFRAVKIAHRAAAASSLRGFGASHPDGRTAGTQFDDAVRAAGLDVRPTPAFPGVTILWDQAAGQAPQPVAVLLDGTEPLWRSRPTPTKVPDLDAQGQPDPNGIIRWQLVDKPWLRVEPGSANQAGIEAVVRAPGEEQAIVVLSAGSRGKRLVLALRRIAFTEAFLEGASAMDSIEAIVDLTLARAPWEES
jgi:hypothetical protein